MEQKSNGLLKITNSIKLSKEQTLFNQLSVKLNKLTDKLQDLGNVYRVRYSLFNQEVKPLFVEEEKLEKNLLKRLYYSDRDLLSKKEYNIVEEYISIKIMHFVKDLGTDEELQTIHDEYSPVSFDQMKDIVNDQMREQMEYQFGENIFEEIGLEDFDFADESEENRAKFAKAMYEKFKDHKFEEYEEEKNSKKKTKTQIKKEELEKKKEELKNKSLKSIFHGLSKILHPDLEKDETLKYEKEEAMKIASNAYESKDLNTLLKLEMYWLTKQSDELDKLADDKIAIYNEIIKDQIKELEYQVDALKQKPEYEVIEHLMGLNDENFNSRINQMKQLQIFFNKDLNEIVALDLVDKKQRKTVISYLTKYVQKEEENQMQDFLRNF